jgi:hypothetical protein
MMRVVRACSRQAVEEIPMLQRALQVAPPPVMLGAREPLNMRALLRTFVEHSLPIVRRLGEFAAAGGPLS